MPAPTSPSRKADNDVLFKGIVCALIGAIILLAPYVARSPDVRDIMVQARIVGWFALALGIAFLVQYAVRRNRRRVLDAETASYLEQNTPRGKSGRRRK